MSLDDQEFIEKVEALYKKLAYSDFYSILGVEKWATLSEIKKAYYSAVKEFHPDKHLSLPSDTLKNKLNAIFSYLTAAYKTLSDSQKRIQYDNNLSNKHFNKVERDKRELAKIKFKEGLEEFKRGLNLEAKKLFEQAIYLDNSVGEYFYYMGLALKLEKRWHEAGKFLNLAIKLDPLNPDYLAELGNIFIQLGFKLRAKKTFEKVIKLDPFNGTAIKGLKNVKKFV